MANTQLWVQAKTNDPAINYNAQQLRQMFTAMYPIEGVLGTGHLKVTQRAAGANMSVDVAPGGCVVVCDRLASGGNYLEFEDATVNVSIPTAPPSGSRTHLIVEQARDPQIDGQALYPGAPICIPDTGSGAAQPQSSYLLAKVTVAAGQASVVNSMITDMRNQASGPPDSVQSDGPQPYVTSDSGRVTISHGLGVRPGNIFTQLANAGNDGNPNYKAEVFWNTATPDANAFIVQLINPSTLQNAAAGQKVYISWEAKR
jgi:hypothetical protein